MNELDAIEVGSIHIDKRRRATLKTLPGVTIAGEYRQFVDHEGTVTLVPIASEEPTQEANRP